MQTLDGKRALDSYFDELRRENPNVKVGGPELGGNVSTLSVSRGYVEGKG